MPSHRIHRYFSRLLLGKPYGEVHRAIDGPYVVLGRKHRRMFHKPSEAFLTGSLASREHGAGLAGLWHVWLDKKGSKDKNFKRWVEFMERQDTLLRKDTRRWQKLQRGK